MAGARARGARAAAEPACLTGVGPSTARSHPVHVTLRAHAGVPSLREQPFDRVEAALARGSKPSFRILHYSVQREHIHLLVEADDKERLSRGMQGLAIRLARAVNRGLARKGSVFADRYHAQPVTTPLQTRFAIVYVIQNWRKHAGDGSLPSEARRNMVSVGQLAPLWSPRYRGGSARQVHLRLN